jgi:hypothetical protein
MWFWPKVYVNFSIQLFIYFLLAGFAFSTCQTRLIFLCFHHAHYPKFSQTRLTSSLHDYYFSVGSRSFFVICYFSFLCFFSMFFLVLSILFFVHSFFKFNNFWVLGGSRDAQRAELFIIYWPELMPKIFTQSKPSSDQTITRPNRSLKWTEVSWDIETISCFRWTIFNLNPTKTDRCPP